VTCEDPLGVSSLDTDGPGLATRYIFGIETNDPLFIRVGSIRPQGRDSIQISGSVINDAVYQDPGTAPAIGSFYGTPALLASFNLTYDGPTSDGYEFSLSWSGRADEVKIELNTGAGYSTLVDNYTDHAYTFETAATSITVKVTPYDGATLVPGEAQTADYVVKVAPVGLACDADEDGLSISWTAYASADSYNLRLEVDEEEIATAASETNSYAMSMHDMLLLEGPWPEFTLYLSAVVDDYESVEAELEVEVDPLDAPATVDFQTRLANGVAISWDAVDGARSYVVCYDDSDDEFEPDESNVVYRGEQPAASIGGLVMTGSYTHYFKVAAQQYDHAIADLDFSAALTVTPGTADVSVHAVSLSSGNNQDYIGPAGGSSYTYQLSGTASGDDETVVATLTGGGSGSAYCVGEGDSDGGDTTAALAAASSGASNVCNVAISGGGSFDGSLIITRIA
jgi:hypothetical protein